jgi:plasmid stability protein
MGQMLIRDLDDAVIAQIKERAKTNKRSAAAEVRLIVEQEIARSKANSRVSKKTLLELAGSHPTNRTPEEIVAEIRALRDEWEY